MKLGDIILRDTRANQPAAGTEGRLYYVTDETVTERDSGSAWEDISDAGGGGGGGIGDRVRVSNSSAQSIGDNTFTSLTFDTEQIDTNTLHSTVSNQSRLTCQTTGLYLIGGNISWAVNTSNRRVARLLLNGTTEIQRDETQGTVANAEPSNKLNTIYNLTSGDYVEFQVYQNSGGSLNTLPTGTNGQAAPVFWMVQLA